MKANKTEAKWRTFPHANSKRELAARFRSDAEEVAEYTDAPLLSRNGGWKNREHIPNIYDDEYTCMSDKYPVKPKRNRKGSRTIRKEEIQ